MILAGDIGGTKTVLALFEPEGGALRKVRERAFPSQDYPSLEAIVERFLEEVSADPPQAAGFGIAGPVHDGKVRTTNLPWSIESESLARAARTPRLELINDLQATGYGMLCLPPEAFATIQAGDARPGNAGVIAPGTGLGEAMLFWDGQRYHPIASEAGHADFAARSDQEIALLRYLRGRFGGRVSYERVLCGDGIRRIYDFLRDTGRVSEPSWVRDRLNEGDPNAAITAIALAGDDPVCVETLDLFCAMLGAEAGNLALRCTALSGIFVAGGIAPQILAALRSGAFFEAFHDKGRFSDWMKAIPVRVALDPRAALLGAAHWTLEQAAGDVAGSR